MPATSYQFQQTALVDYSGIELVALQNGAAINQQAFLSKLAIEEFALAFSQALAQSDFTAAFWETPCYRASSANQPFSCVLINAPALARLEANPAPFAKHMANAAPADAVQFANLSGHSQLIVPSQFKQQQYPHLLAFLRTAPEPQIIKLWQQVSQAALSCDSSKFWLSTAGLGVAWLHIRIDQQPKYYRYLPYKSAA